MSFDFRLEWTRDIHQRTPRAIAFTDFGIIVPERHSRLVRLDETNGQAIWEAKIKNPWGWLTVTQRYVAYLNQYNLLQCFDLETGKTLWERTLAGECNGYLVAKEQHLITGGWRGATNVTCLDIASGTTAWVNPEKESYAIPILSPPVRENYAIPIMSPWGIILAVSADDQLKSLQLLNYEHGTIQFEIGIPAKVPVTDLSAGIQLAGDTLYATTLHGEVYSLDFKQQRWILRAHHTPGIRTVTPSHLNNCLLFLDQDKQLCCYDLGDGRLKWRQALEHNEPEFIPATRYGNMLIIGTSQGQLIAVDDLGNRIWARTVGKRITTPLFMTDGGQLILGTTGAIVSYRLVTPTNSDTRPTTG
jgi:outer membrane protein assembly factor BamB